MAKSGAKKRFEANAARLKVLRLVVLGGVLAHLVGLGVSYARSGAAALTAGKALGLVGAGLVHLFAYRALAAHAAPALGPDGSLLDGGGDLDAPGVTSYAHDLVYLTAFCEAGGALVSPYVWLLWLAVPAFALYQLWVNVAAPWFSAGGDTEQDDAGPVPGSRKERRKLEREQAKQKATKKGR